MCLILIFPEKFRRGEKIAFPWGKVAARQGRRMRGGRDLQLRTVSWPPLRGGCLRYGQTGEVCWHEK